MTQLRVTAAQYRAMVGADSATPAKARRVRPEVPRVPSSEPFAATFEVPGRPAPKGSSKMLPRGKREDGSTIWVVGSDNDGLKRWEEAVVNAARPHAPAKPVTGSIEITVVFRFSVLKNAPKNRRLPMTSKPDLSKLLRGIEDGLSGLYYVDDAQITDASIKKRRAYDGVPGATITVAETDGLS